ncbi:MAG: Hsp70 family protein [Gloeomargarita sp. SKYBB_i_bin120]|nr:Hsp70 family protein [Gloeomargarita sp. SKYG98]MCS7291631.1 Hsp70 family protein [Gloeomargarita sp. SKYB120]MDW8177190.1 Hsp70 family protein [Gloeomargarita sp. SKYBB_i_bin120]
MDYALDFGSSNTVIARRSPVTGQPEIVALPGLSQPDGLIPTLVCEVPGDPPTVLCGQQVREYLHQSPHAPVFHHFKRSLLHASDEAKRVGTTFLQRLLQGLHQQNYAINALVLTAPVDAFEPYRQWLTEMAHAWRVTQIRLLDEPTAAALGYGVAESDLVLVVDGGGGTLDLALVQLQRPGTRTHLGWILRWGDRVFDDRQRPCQAQVIAKAGVNLGGADIDRWIFDYLVQREGYAAGEFIPLTLAIAERLKIQLSDQPSSHQIYFDPRTGYTRHWFLERTELDQILRDQAFFAQLDAVMQYLWAQARVQGYRPRDVDAVLLVGGMSQMPAVRQWLHNYFPPSKIHHHRSLAVVAHGALRLNLTAPIQDFLYHSYGLRYWDKRRQGHHWHELIPAGHPYPSPEPIELVLGASRPDQTAVELVLGELRHPTGQGAVYVEQGRLVLRSIHQDPDVQILNAALHLPLDPPGQPGEDRLHLAFRVNADRQLCLTARDLHTGRLLCHEQPVLTLA